MPILIKHDGRYYEIPDNVLETSGISREKFEKRLKLIKSDAKNNKPSLSDYNFIDLSDAEAD
jgi:hypothetical protein